MIHSAVDKFHCGWKCHTHRPSLFFLLLVTDINVKFWRISKLRLSRITKLKGAYLKGLLYIQVDKQFTVQYKISTVDENVTHIDLLYFLLLVTDINVKFNEHVLMRARHLNLSQKRLQPQLRNALALSIRVSSSFEFLAEHTNQGPGVPQITLFLQLHYCEFG